MMYLRIIHAITTLPSNVQFSHDTGLRVSWGAWVRWLGICTKSWNLHGQLEVLWLEDWLWARDCVMHSRWIVRLMGDVSAQSLVRKIYSLLRVHSCLGTCIPHSDLSHHFPPRLDPPRDNVVATRFEYETRWCFSYEIFHISRYSFDSMHHPKTPRLISIYLKFVLIRGSKFKGVNPPLCPFVRLCQRAPGISQQRK